MNDELMNRARELLALHDKAREAEKYLRAFDGFESPAADTIAELLAENERLTARLRELASEEPSAYLRVTPCEASVPLIRRPDMPK